MSVPTTAYEQPLNERIRAFLRLEYLFERAAYRLDGPTIWDTRATLDALIDIMALLGRADLKTEIIKELERQAGNLEALSSNPGVDPDRLRPIVDSLKRLLANLRTSDSTPGQELRQNELLGNIRQRSSIPAGTCSFDVPAFQHWLERPAQERMAQLGSWLGEFDLIRDAVTLCLSLIRESAHASREVARGGFFQRTLEPGTTCQMVRVVIPGDHQSYPEISGGRHRFTVRFMHQAGTGARPTQESEDVEFELQCCVI